jgi:hypothetical protein
VADKELVTQEDLADGRVLLQQLAQASFPVTAAFWAYDPLLESWRLIIAAPREAVESLLGAYEVIQRIIISNGLGVTLDRISLIPDSGAKLDNLRTLAESDTEGVVEASVGRAEIAGRIVDDIHLYSSSALRYEREVFQALQRIQPSNAIMRTYRSLQLPRGVEVDALVDNGVNAAIVEIKALKRPLGSRDIFQVQGQLYAYRRFLNRSLAVAIIVSLGDFTQSALEAARESEVIPVQWTGSEDDEKLGHALNEALARNADS